MVSGTGSVRHKGGNLDPVTVESTIIPTVEKLAKLLREKTKKEIGTGASEISKKTPESKVKVRGLFN